MIASSGKTDSLELRFLDSFKFMSSSLDKLAQYLPTNEFHLIRSAFRNDDEFDLIRRKGVYPYDYVSSFERLNECELPPREMFYNRLSDSHCSEEQYKHAQKVWEKFNCSNISEYMQIYLKSDVLLLADIFENFRKDCKNVYNLDPCQYFTAPELSWDAMLRKTNIELELFLSQSMHSFIQRGIRGGICQV